MTKAAELAAGCAVQQDSLASINYAAVIDRCLVLLQD